jgi:phosphohistidine phosphatase
MRIYLARHGEALPVTRDPERSLSEAGTKQVAHVSGILEQAGAGVDRMIHSGKPRARQTAEILARAVMREPELETAGDLNPMDPVEPWVERAAQLEQDTMLVGHLPFMSRLLTMLVTGAADPGLVDFPPAAVACLERTREGKWLIVTVVRPGL